MGVVGVVRPLLLVYRGYEEMSWERIFLCLFLSGALACFVVYRTAQLCRQLRFRARLDETSLTIRTDHGTVVVPLAELDSVVIELFRTTGEPGAWVTVRDRSGRVLAQWDREWFRYSSGSLRRFDELTKILFDMAHRAAMERGGVVEHPRLRGRAG